jgi:hypothetical protein
MLLYGRTFNPWGDDLMRLGTHLVGKGLVTAEQIVQALDQQMKERIPIGQLAIRTGYLTLGQVFKILSLQAERHRPFGRIAVELGFLTEDKVTELLRIQARRNRSVEEILVQMGAIDRATLEAEAAQLAPSVEDQPILRV